MSCLHSSQMSLSAKSIMHSFSCLLCFLLSLYFINPARPPTDTFQIQQNLLCLYSVYISLYQSIRVASNTVSLQ